MSDDYPREEELNRIREWTYEEGYEVLAEYVKRLWKWPEFGFVLRDWHKDDFDTGTVNCASLRAAGLATKT